VKIHFICNGNIFRSVIAEAYLKSLHLSVDVMSSGTRADLHRQENQVYLPGIQKLLKKHGLAAFHKTEADQLTQERIHMGDVTICVNEIALKNAQRVVKLPSSTLVWDVDDIDEGNRLSTNGNRATLYEAVFHEVKAEVDSLITDLKLVSTYDIFDSNDKPLDKTATYNEVHTQGLWHRGVHVIIYTPDKKVVMQKRSINLAYHPGEVEISVGGGVDAGETPAEAIYREALEELGLDLSSHKVRFIGKTKSNHRTKSQINRTHIYSYAVCIPESELRFMLDTAETESAFLMPESSLRRALKTHRIKHVGRITSTYSYWRWLLDNID
jgi:isopentenyl-diphosphate delta-isomerase